MHKNTYCNTISPLLSGYVNRTLNEQETDQVKEHLSTCPICQGVVDALEVSLHAYDIPRANLWPRLQSKLSTSKEEDEIYLSFPPLTWPMSVALAVIILTLLVVPEPWRLLVIIGLL